MSESSTLAAIRAPEELVTNYPNLKLVSVYHVLSDEKQRRSAERQVGEAVEILTKAFNAVSVTWQEKATGENDNWVARRFWVGCEEKVSCSELRTLVSTALSQHTSSHLRATVVPANAVTPERRMLIMDVDSTLINEEVIDQLAAHAGKEKEVAAVTEAAMRGELDFAQSLHKRVATLENLPLSVIEDVQQNRVSLTPGARRLVKAYQAHGWPVCVVSGGFVQVLKPIAEDLKLDRYEANVLEVARTSEGEILTGKVIGEVVDRVVKAEKLRQWAEEFRVDPSAVVAVGDGANDLDMLQAAGIGVAFCAKPALREHADVIIQDRRLDLVSLVTGL